MGIWRRRLAALSGMGHVVETRVSSQPSGSRRQAQPQHGHKNLRGFKPTGVANWGAIVGILRDSGVSLPADLQADTQRRKCSALNSLMPTPVRAHAPGVLTPVLPGDANPALPGDARPAPVLPGVPTLEEMLAEISALPYRSTAM